MLFMRLSQVFLPLARAVGQLDDAAFRDVLLRSIALSLASFAALLVGAIYAVHHLLSLHRWLAWGGDILGTIAASVLAVWLFLPIAVGIGTLFFDRIAGAVERRFYPWLGRPNRASVVEQTWDGIAVAAKVLALNVVAIIFAFLIPGIGMILAWLVAAYAIGRGLFVAVAMRRMPRMVAESLYRENRAVILLHGAVLALAAFVPAMNLLIPIIGTATMVHILDMAITSPQQDAMYAR